MKKSEIADLIMMARGFDDRIEEVAAPYKDPERPDRVVEDARLSAWHMVLGDIDYNLALQGLAEMYRAPQMLRLQPGHIFEAAESIRRRNVAAADLTKLEPPDELASPSDPAVPSRMPEWQQAAVAAVGRGFSVEEAQQIADDALQVSRQLIGPTVGRVIPALEPGSRGMQGLDRRLGETA